ncbi:MAG: hypothetical protein ACREP5_11715, partial [Candidatus Binatia bacterium]
MIQPMLLWTMILVGIAGCASGTASRGGTLLLGMAQYQEVMQQTSGQISRWPERQRAAGELKTVITVTVGASTEFYRLVDLDQRTREFMIAMGGVSLKADRIQEMKEELVKMDEESAALRPVIKTQLAAVSAHDPSDPIESVATLGLLGIALDGFAAPALSRGLESPSTKVGQYVVTDLDHFATVRAPDGKNFRCEKFGTLDS